MTALRSASPTDHRRPTLRALGREGERRTAEALTSLPPGWTVLSGRLVPGSRCDIDHVVLGPGGAFAVDAKNTTRVRVYGDALWTSRGTRLDLEPTRFGAASLERSLGVTVVPVVCVVRQELSHVLRDVWVVGLHDVVERVAGRPARFEPEVVAALVEVARRRFAPAGWGWRRTAAGPWVLTDGAGVVLARRGPRVGLQVVVEAQRPDIVHMARRCFGEQALLPFD